MLSWTTQSVMSSIRAMVIKQGIEVTDRGRGEI